MAGVKKGIGVMWKTIQFIDITSQQDGTTGKWEETQTVLATVHASARQIQGANLVESDSQLALDNRYEFEVRYPVNFPINVNTFILYNNRTYRIENISLKEERNFKYLIRAISRDPATIEM